MHQPEALRGEEGTKWPMKLVGSGDGQRDCWDWGVGHGLGGCPVGWGRANSSRMV